MATYWELCIHNGSTWLWCINKGGGFIPLLPGVPYRPYRFRSRQGAVNAYNRYLAGHPEQGDRWKIRLEEKTED